MSTELATTNPDVTVLPAPARPTASAALGQLMQQVEAISAAQQAAALFADSDLVGPDYKGKPGNAAVAILYGAELGLNALQSLQQIFVVHGKPAIYARTAVALLMGQGILFETVSSTDDSVTVRATDPRTGRGEQSTWNLARATTAGYTSNAKYKTDPQAMLYAKAAMEVCRKLAPDVLLGIPYAREELELEPQRVESERAPAAARGVAALREAAAKAAAKASEEQVVGEGTPESPRDKWLNRMFALFGEANARDREDQLTVQTAFLKLEARPEHRDDINDDQLKQLVNQLNDWKREGVLVDKVADVLDMAALAAEAKAAEQAK